MKVSSLMSVRCPFVLAIALLGLPLFILGCSGGDRPQTVVSPSVAEAIATEAAQSGPDSMSAARVLKDVTYCTVDAVELKMDLYYPLKPSQSRPPLVVYVHGGGFISGDKGTGAGYTDVPEMLARGYLVGSVNYRLAPEYPFPAAIQDVKCAIRSLRANADKYGFDPDRIGVWGGSAGGNLVSLLGLTDASAGLDVGEFAGVSSRVSAVVDMFGPSDLRPAVVRPLLGGYLPLTGADALAAAASPITFVTSDDPPFLLLHGQKDTVVPIRESRNLYARLQEVGVPSQLVEVTNAAHGFRPSGGPIEPGRAEISRMVGDFFDRYLKPSRPQ